MLQKSRLPKVITEGLRYGEQGEHSREVYAVRANSFLDQYRPDDAVAKGLSRLDCLYAYLELDGRLLDLGTGEPLALTDWNPGDTKARLALSVDPSIGFVGDLDDYDYIAGLLAKDESDLQLPGLAYAYWQRIIPLPIIIEHYALSEVGIVAKPSAPHYLPRGMNRVEVLLVRSVPPRNITVV